MNSKNSFICQILFHSKTKIKNVKKKVDNKNSKIIWVIELHIIFEDFRRSSPFLYILYKVTYKIILISKVEDPNCLLGKMCFNISSFVYFIIINNFEQ